MIEFRVLGSHEAVDQGRLLALGSPQQRALLAVLLVHRGEPMSSDRLIDELWGERAPASAIKIVQGYVSNLRKVLGDGLLVTRARGYSLQLDAGQLDADRFEALVAEARDALRKGDARAAAVRLREALGLLHPRSRRSARGSMGSRSRLSSRRRELKSSVSRSSLHASGRP